MSSQYRMMTQRKESRMASVEKILDIDIKSNFINIIMFLWGTLYTTSIILNNLVLFPETYVIFTISTILEVFCHIDSNGLHLIWNLLLRLWEIHNKTKKKFPFVKYSPQAMWSCFVGSNISSNLITCVDFAVT